MNFYNLIEKLNSLNASILTEAPPEDMFKDYCAKKIRHLHPLSEYEKYHNRVVEQGIVIPGWQEFITSDDCTAWKPGTKRAAKYLFAVYKEIKRENNPSYDKLYDVDVIKGENFSPWSAIYSQIFTYITKIPKNARWWNLFPDYALAEIKQYMIDFAKIYLDKGKAEELGDHFELIDIDGKEFYVVDRYLLEIIFHKLTQTVNPGMYNYSNESVNNTKTAIDESNKTDQLVNLITREAYIRMPQIFKEYGDKHVMNLIDVVALEFSNKDADIDEMIYSLAEKIDEIENNISLNEGAATVFSDAKGHHLKNADGEVVQSFDKTPEGLRAARNALYANYNVLSIEKPKESVMNEYEDKFNTALNESLTITTTAGTDQPDNVSVNATDEDAHTLVAILKAAGLPYKEQEAKIIAATPCGEQVEEEYSNEPEEKTMSVDYMVNQLSGGLGKQQKMYRKEYPGDNAMAVNEENLMRGLWDLYKKV